VSETKTLRCNIGRECSEDEALLGIARRALALGFIRRDHTGRTILPDRILPSQAYFEATFLKPEKLIPIEDL
jgi:hypothetical protein